MSDQIDEEKFEKASLEDKFAAIWGFISLCGASFATGLAKLFYSVHSDIKESIGKGDIIYNGTELKSFTNDIG